jgi:hypothetical protein
MMQQFCVLLPSSINGNIEWYDWMDNGGAMMIKMVQQN